MSDDPDVLVVGGGISGLTCAVALAAEGLRVEVLEKAGALGGRAASWTDPTTGDVIDIGPHILFSEYPNFLALLDLLGTRDQIVWQEAGVFVTFVDGQDAYSYRLAKLPAPFHLVPSALADSRLRRSDTVSAMRVTRLALTATEQDFAALDEVNALSFLKRMGVSAGHLERYWHFAAMAIMNVPLELCSASALLRLHRRIMGNNDFQVGFCAEGLAPLYVPSATRWLEERGSRVRTGAAVRRLVVGEERPMRPPHDRAAPGRVVGVETEGGEVQRARYVVAAVPPQALRALVPREWLNAPRFEKLVRFQPSPYVSVYLWFDEKLTTRQFWARSYRPNDLNLDFYDLSNINPRWAGRPSVIASNIIYSHRADALTDEQVISGTRSELAEFLPRAATATLRHAVVNRIPMAVPCPYPGTTEARSRAGELEGGLVLAGDWTDTGLPASMESAACAGWQAAEAVLAAEGRPRPLAKPHQELVGGAKWFNRGLGAPRRLRQWVTGERGAR